MLVTSGSASVVTLITREDPAEQVSQCSQLTFKGNFQLFQETFLQKLLWKCCMKSPSDRWRDYILTQGGWESSFCFCYFLISPQLSHRAAHSLAAILDCYAFHNNSKIITNIMKQTAESCLILSNFQTHVVKLLQCSQSLLYQLSSVSVCRLLL